MKKTKILIADDHTLFRQSLRRTLELDDSIAVIGEASDGAEALKLAQESQPDVVLLDIRMQKMNGIETTKRIKQSLPNVGIIIVTMYDDDDCLFETIKAGANGYVLKTTPVDQLLVNIKTVAEGNSLLNSNIARRVLDEFARLAESRKQRENQALTTLTSRETEILNLIARGNANKEIARKLFISEKTVKNHISHIYHKLHCNDRAHAVLEGVTLGIIDVERNSDQPTSK